MNIHEFQGKLLLKQYNVPVQEGVVVDKDDKIYSNNENIEKISSFVNLLKNVSIIFINNDNIEKGWVTKMWNKAFKRAYDEGCQYFA